MLIGKVGGQEMTAHDGAETGRVKSRDLVYEVVE
jgi:hypothetical protein